MGLMDLMDLRDSWERGWFPRIWSGLGCPQ